MARALNLAAGVIGIDSYIGTLQRALAMGEDLGKRWDAGHVDIPGLREGGMHAAFFGAEPVCRTLDLRDAMPSVLDAHPDQVELATATDIERIVRRGKISAFLTIEGGHQIDDDLRVLRMYYRSGIRSMTLTHSRNNNWADSLRGLRAAFHPNNRNCSLDTGIEWFGIVSSTPLRGRRRRTRRTSRPARAGDVQLGKTTVD